MNKATFTQELRDLFKGQKVDICIERPIKGHHYVDGNLVVDYADYVLYDIKVKDKV